MVMAPGSSGGVWSLTRRWRSASKFRGPTVLSHPSALPRRRLAEPPPKRPPMPSTWTARAGVEPCRTRSAPRIECGMQAGSQTAPDFLRGPRRPARAGSGAPAGSARRARARIIGSSPRSSRRKCPSNSARNLSLTSPQAADRTSPSPRTARLARRAMTNPV